MLGINHQGEAIFFSNSGTGVNAPVAILDANLVARPLQSFERLILDAVTCDTAGGGQYTLVASGKIVVVFDDATTSSNLPSLFIAGPNGISLPVGVTPSFNGNGGFPAVITGVGRIVAITIRGRQPWQAKPV